VTGVRTTYRVQLNAGFTFDNARAIVPYLAELGVSTLYTSPFLRATPGSTHGYDVTDYAALNPEIGNDENLDQLSAALRERRMGLLVDVVPNHMGIAGGANAWWQDLLENGHTSPYADFFDIDWRPLKEELRGKILLPVLGDPYGVVLERGELRLTFQEQDGAFTVYYYDTPFPIAPPTYPLILNVALDSLNLLPSPSALGEGLGVRVFGDSGGAWDEHGRSVSHACGRGRSARRRAGGGGAGARGWPWRSGRRGRRVRHLRHRRAHHRWRLPACRLPAHPRA